MITNIKGNKVQANNRIQNISISEDQNNQILKRLLEKESEICAKQNNIDLQEFQAWIDTQMNIPIRSLLSLLRTANQYSFDPLKEEVLVSQYDETWIASIGIDGWIKLMNSHPYFAGITFTESADLTNGLPIWIECTLFRSDRVIPLVVREYLEEVKNDTESWKKMPRRI